VFYFSPFWKIIIITTLWYLWLRYDLTNAFILRLKPQNSHFNNSISWIMQSNTFYKSQNIPPTVNDLHLPQVTLAMYQKWVYFSDITIFNSIPKAIKDISRKPNKFKIALKHFLHTHTFYSIMNFLTNSNVSLLLCSYNPVILYCTIALNFFVTLH
jgi:hypothetical protein